MKKLAIPVIILIVIGCAAISEDEVKAKQSEAYNCTMQGLVWMAERKTCVTQGAYRYLKHLN